MNKLWENKLNELNNIDKEQCWYIVKHNPEIMKLCYYVSFLEEFQLDEKIRQKYSVQDYINKRVTELNSEKGWNIVSNYRTLMVASYYGLILKTAKKGDTYDNAPITQTFQEIKDRCNGEFEKIEMYNDIIQRQIEKIFITTIFDDEYTSKRKDYKLFPVIYLYKILLELGNATGKYSIPILLYNTLILTSEKYQDYLETLTLIKLLETETEAFEILKSKIGTKFSTESRWNRTLALLDTLEVTSDSITLKDEYRKEVASKVFQFENGNYSFNDDEYLHFLASTKSLLNSTHHSNTYSPTSLTPLILYGPPGTGKTYAMQHDYIKNFTPENCFVTTFHQSFSYEEFVEGLKPVLAKTTSTDTSSDVKYKIEKGVFYKACERAAQLAGYESLNACIADTNRKQQMSEAIQSGNTVLLCIDEINRANVSAVFGDLISLIESSKRLGAENEMIVRLPYSKTEFAVPANLMIVGTMNTADRSIQLLDSALRRRFSFKELMPDYGAIQNENAKSILSAINARIRCLLGKDNQIGHSYFIDVKSELDIFNALTTSVIPLLEEYFFNEIQKIRQVLNEKADNENHFYVKDEDAQNASNNMEQDYDDEREFYMLNPSLANVKDNETAKLFIEHIANA